MTDWIYYALPNLWKHPETGVRILAEDMPWELKPESNHD